MLYSSLCITIVPIFHLLDRLRSDYLRFEKKKKTEGYVLRNPNVGFILQTLNEIYFRLSVRACKEGNIRLIEKPRGDEIYSSGFGDIFTRRRVYGHVAA